MFKAGSFILRRSFRSIFFPCYSRHSWRLFFCLITVSQLIFLFVRYELFNKADKVESLLQPHRVIDELPVSFGLEKIKLPNTKEELSTTISSGKLRDCTLPIPSPVNISHSLDIEAYSWNELDSLISNRLYNGTWWPQGCTARHHVAVIVAYRERDKNLRVFLHNLHAFLQRQNIHYAIFIIEQAQGSKFNRASLFNVGFLEAIHNDNLFDCFVFHDVDLLPEDNRNLYNCGEHPRHMSTAINIFQYKLPYDGIFGGVSALNKSQFARVNGFSNAYFGWGGEDDDMSNRLVQHGLDFARYPLAIGRYYMLPHGRDNGNRVNPVRRLLLRNGAFRVRKDGLNSLRYSVIDRPNHRLMVHIVVRLHETAILKNISIEVEKFKKSQKALGRKRSSEGFTIWHVCLIVVSLLYLVYNAVFIFQNVHIVVTKVCNCERFFCAT